MTPMPSTSTQYRDLKKPSWAPPSWLFGPVWTVLYVLIAMSFGAVFLMAARGELAWAVTIPFAINLAANIAYTPLQFGLRNRWLASLDILIVLTTIIVAMWVIAPLVPWVAWLQIPYLLWVSFATCLQLTVTWLNR